MQTEVRGTRICIGASSWFNTGGPSEVGEIPLMGRNLWVNDTTFSRDFTILIWDDLLDLFPSRPEPPTAVDLKSWLREVRRRGKQGPTIYQIWRNCPQGRLESAVAHARALGEPVQIEGCYDRLTLSRLDQMPELDYEPPEWTGPERFSEAFRGTPLSLQAEPIAVYFGSELERLNEALEAAEVEFGIL